MHGTVVQSNTCLTRANHTCNVRKSRAHHIPSSSARKACQPISGLADIASACHSAYKQTQNTRSIVVLAASAETAPTATAIADGWSAFCENVSGEWEGATATFSADGQPQELPAQYVPKEYSDWDVTLYDWQSQCSMQPQSSGIKCLFKRILPTVGCEADAQTYNEEKRQLLETANGSAQHATLENGSYTTASALNLNGQTSLRAEHCLVIADKKRIRLVQHLKAAEPSGLWQLQSVEMHHEYHDGPYNSGASLSGCGGGMSNFAESARLETSQLEQHWTVQSGRSYSVAEDNRLQEQDLPIRLSKANQEGMLCLPLNTYSMAQSSAPGALLLSAGVVLKDGTMVVAQQLFEKGLCVKISLASEAVKP